MSSRLHNTLSSAVQEQLNIPLPFHDYQNIYILRTMNDYQNIYILCTMNIPDLQTSKDIEEDIIYSYMGELEENEIEICRFESGA